MNLLAAYIAAWEKHDIPAVLATLTNDCVVTESYGPVYHGRGGVEEWMRAWFEEGGSVQSWVINRDLSTDDVLVAEWTFRCIWRNELATFDGATIAISKGPQIQELREYATTGTLYDWKVLGSAASRPSTETPRAGEGKASAAFWQGFVRAHQRSHQAWR